MGTTNMAPIKDHLCAQVVEDTGKLAIPVPPNEAPNKQIL